MINIFIRLLKNQFLLYSNNIMDKIKLNNIMYFIIIILLCIIIYNQTYKKEKILQLSNLTKQYKI